MLILVLSIVATENSKCAEESGVFEFTDAISPACLSSCERSFLGLCRFRSRAIVEPENLSVSIVPRCSPEREGAEPFRVRSPSQVVAKLFLEFHLPLPRR